MDRKIISYDRALEAVDTAVSLLDVPTISSTLKNFPVLQVRASQRLLCEIPRLIKVSEKTTLVHDLAVAIGCIVAPLGLSTVECKLCATTLYYGIRDQDERLSYLLIKRILIAKRDCFGCGLFVQTVLSESLQLRGKLPDYLKDIFHSDHVEHIETGIESWKEVSNLLQREGFIASIGGIPDAKPRAPSSVRMEGKRRLHLWIEGRNEIQKRRNHKITTSFRTSPGTLESRKERQLLLKLVTLYAAFPELLAEKIRARGLQSHCSAKVLALRNSLSLSKGHHFTSDELHGMTVLGSANFRLSLDTASMRCSSKSRGKLSTELDCAANGGQLLNTYKVWMPLTVGINNLIHAAQNRHHNIDTILEEWNSAKGLALSSVDQIMIAGLAHDRVLEDLLGLPFSRKQSITTPRRVNGKPDSQTSSAIGTVRECFRILDGASERGFGYPIAFWEQSMKVFAVLESAIVLLLLTDKQNVYPADVNTLIIHSRNIAGRLLDRVKYRQTEPRTKAAVLKVCGCLSVGLEWKYKRRIRSSILKSCRCMIPNIRFFPVPKPGLWFFWVMSGSGQESRNFPQGVKESISISRWLYRNPARRTSDYNFSSVEIVHGIVNTVLRDGSALISEVADILAHVLKDPSFRNQIFFVLANCSKTVVSVLDTKSSNEKGLTPRLRRLRTGVEKIWSIIGHKSNQSLFPLHTRITAEELGHIEDLFANVVPCLKGMHDSVGDMPSFCEYVAIMYRMLNSGEDIRDCLVRVKIITGLMYPQLRGKNLPASGTGRQDGLFETVMLCFE